MAQEPLLASKPLIEAPQSVTVYIYHSSSVCS
nr:MAG TPA: hypothetical protein [Caudoviricetes sp.]